MEPTDYQGNPRKNKDQKSEKVTPDKHIDPVVTGKVIPQKRSFGRKVKDVVFLADFGSVSRYVGQEVVIPGLRNFLYDIASEGLKRSLFGERAINRQNTSRYTYPFNNSPMSSRGYTDYRSSRNPRLMPQEPRMAQRAGTDFIISSKEEAELVLSTMQDILDQYGEVQVAQFYELLNLTPDYTHVAWGWPHLDHVEIRQLREGFLIDLPPAEPIN